MTRPLDTPNSEGGNWMSAEAPWRHSLRELVATTPAPLFGLAFCRAWSQWAVATMEPGVGPALTGRPLYDAACVVAAICLAALSPKVGDLFNNRAATLTAAVAMCAVPLLAALAPSGGWAVLNLVAIAAGGAGFLVMSVAWVCLYATFGPVKAVLLFCMERIASEALIFVYAGFTEAYLTGALVLSPLASLVCLRSSATGAPYGQEQAAADGLRPIPWKPALFMFVYAFAYTVARSAANGGFLLYPATFLALVPPLLFLVCIACFPQRFNLGSFYLIACPAMMAAIMLPALFPIFPDQMVKGCLEISYSTAIVTEVFLVVGLSHRLRISPLWLFAFVRAFRYAGLLLGWLFVDVTGGLRGENGSYVSAVLTACIVAVSLMLISEHGGNANWGILPKSIGRLYTGKELDARIVRVGSLFGLSQREVEVLGYLADGKTAGAISTRLNLAEGTVKAHIQHIYQKTGCHTRRELLALVHAEQPA